MNQSTDKIKRVAVIMGGPSSEYNVSLNSGQNIIRHLNPEKYLIMPLVVSISERWLCHDFIAPEEVAQWNSAEFFQNSSQFLDNDSIQGIQFLKGKNIDIIFLAMHGRYGEDGRLQSFLELAGLKYTGSGPLASSLAIHKPGAKRLCTFHDLLVARDILVYQNNFEELKDTIIGKILHLGSKVVMKVMDSGSSLDMAILEGPDEKDIYQNLKKLLEKGDVIVEEYITGRELTCGVLEKYVFDGTRKSLIIEALAVTEIRPKSDSFFSYEAKYTPGATQEITPAPIPSHVSRRIQELAIHCHKTLHCSHYSRSDFILSGFQEGRENYEIFYLETNTLPGMTRTSLIPQAAEAVGIDMNSLLDRIIELALGRS